MAARRIHIRLTGLKASEPWAWARPLRGVKLVPLHLAICCGGSAAACSGRGLRNLRTKSMGVVFFGMPPPTPVLVRHPSPPGSSEGARDDGAQGKEEKGENSDGSPVMQFGPRTTLGQGSASGGSGRFDSLPSGSVRVRHLSAPPS